MTLTAPHVRIGRWLGTRRNGHADGSVGMIAHVLVSSHLISSNVIQYISSPVRILEFFSFEFGARCLASASPASKFTLSVANKRIEPRLFSLAETKGMPSKCDVILINTAKPVVGQTISVLENAINPVFSKH
jgi:hypothetical protein